MLYANDWNWVSKVHTVWRTRNWRSCTAQRYLDLGLDNSGLHTPLIRLGRHCTAQEEDSDSRGTVAKRRGDFAERSLSEAKTE